MKVKILGHLSYQSFPLTDDMIECDEQELNRIGIDRRFDDNGNIVEYFNPINKINELKQLLQKYKEDVEQVELFGMERADYEEKKQACADIILELRELESQLKEENVEEGE